MPKVFITRRIPEIGPNKLRKQSGLDVQQWDSDDVIPRDRLLKAVKDKESQHIEIYDHLGDVLMALGERTAALDAWRKAISVAGEGRREQDRKALVEKKLQMKK